MDRSLNIFLCWSENWYEAWQNARGISKHDKATKSFHHVNKRDVNENIISEQATSYDLREQSILCDLSEWFMEVSAFLGTPLDNKNDDNYNNVCKMKGVD